MYSKLKFLNVGVIKVSIKVHLVIQIRPETRRFSLEQIEDILKNVGGFNPYLLHKIGMTCGWE